MLSIEKTMEETYKEHPDWVAPHLASMHEQYSKLSALTDEHKTGLVVARLDYLKQAIATLEQLTG